MEIPLFNGHMRIEGVLDWLTDVEHFFDVMEILEKQKVKLVSVQLKAGVSVYWEQTLVVRARQQLLIKK